MSDKPDLTSILDRARKQIDHAPTIIELPHVTQPHHVTADDPRLMAVKTAYIRQGIVTGRVETPSGKKYEGTEAFKCVIQGLVSEGRGDKEIRELLTDKDFPISAVALRQNDVKEFMRKTLWAARAVVRQHNIKRGEQEQEQRPSTAGKTRIYHNELDLERVLDQMQEALVRSPAGLYAAGGRLVHVYRQDQDSPEDEEVRRKAGALVQAEVGSMRLREYAIKYIDLYEVKPDKDGKPFEKSIPPPLGLIGHIKERQDRWRFPVLNGVIETPVMLADGTILSQEGYHPESGLLLRLGGVKYPEIPDEPTREQGLAALAIIKEVIKEFPFVDDVARSVALAAILTPFVCRSVMNTPLIGIDATAPGTGKSLLCNAIALIATGRRATVMSQPPNEVEAKKMWLAILLQGDLIIIIDNIDQPLGGATMCSVITETSLQDRILGATGMGRAPTNVTLLANGNNLTFSGDLTARSIKCRMDAGCDNPEEIPHALDLYSYIPEHRPELVAACLTVLRAWAVADPFEVDLKQSRFPGWDQTVRGALVWLGEADPILSQAGIKELDPVRSDLKIIIAELRKTFGQQTFTSAQIEKLCRGEAAPDGDDYSALADALRSQAESGKATTRSITGALARFVGTPVGGYRLARHKAGDKAFWRIEQVESPGRVT